jgi:hypothetical protein
MAKFEVDIGNATYEVDAADEKSAWQMANQFHAKQPTQSPLPAQSSASRYPNLARIGVNPPMENQTAVEGFARGMGDPFLGGAQLAASAFSPRAKEFIDQTINEGEKAYNLRRQQAGDTGFDVSRLAGNVLNPANLALAARLPAAMVSTLPRLLGTGSVLGGVSSALTPITDEKEQQDFGEAKRGQVGLGMMIGPITQGAGKAIGAVGGNIAQRVSESSAANEAKLKLAEALQRSGMGSFFQGGGGNPLKQAEARLLTRGPEATVADVSGQSGKTLLDTLASLPGQAKDLTEQMIKNRQATRSKRLITAADEAMGTSGKTYTGTLDSLINEKKTASKPFYNQLEGVSFRVDDELAKLIKASETAHGGAELLAKLKQTTPIDISKIKVGDDIPLDSLDKIKQALYDLGEETRGKFGQATTLSSAYNDLRNKLTNKLDRLSPTDDKGRSIYKMARDSFAGPAQLETALRKGRDSMKEDAIAIKELTKDMSESEISAFRLGAVQAIKDKVGTEAGQTALTKMWKEPATSGKLKEIFGPNYRDFAASVAREQRLKELETVGRGSQTMSRIFAAGDLDNPANLLNAGQAAASAAQGNIAPAMGMAAQAWNKVKMPEQTRNELAKLLLQKGPEARQTIAELPTIVKQYNEEQLRKALLANALAQQPNR